MRGPSPLYIEERHRALGRDATFSWSRALTHPPRCNRTCHRGRHLDFVGAAILVSWGPPSWTGSHGGRHLGSDVVTSLTLKWHLYYSFITIDRLTTFSRTIIVVRLSCDCRAKVVRLSHDGFARNDKPRKMNILASIETSD